MCDHNACATAGWRRRPSDAAGRCPIGIDAAPSSACTACFGCATYAGDCDRPLIARVGHGPEGANPSFILTSVTVALSCLSYKHLGAGAENCIKDARIDLSGRRANSRRFWANPVRLSLAAPAYSHALVATVPTHASTATIRVRLPVIAKALVRNSRHVDMMLGRTTASTTQRGR
ncbi:transposase [Aquincola sp. MAHUQ-54]|uniref:Transposase n=1 Tax=Aquincola agrisoli TaxID=3119538 RepID=A0AAW9QDT5_9BURK